MSQRLERILRDRRQALQSLEETSAAANAAAASAIAAATPTTTTTEFNQREVGMECFGLICIL